MKAGQLPLPPLDQEELGCFCRIGTNRQTLLTDSLTRRGLDYEILALGEARHIVVSPPKSTTWEREYYRVILVAHYDRVPQSPGANDNAAAVFQLLSHLEESRDQGRGCRTQVIFTDKEELGKNSRATDQGSWGLAKELKRWGVENVLFFVLDMCGIGNMPIWGRSLHKAGLTPLPDSSQENSYMVMESFLKRFTLGRDFGINPLFSDDLGLLLGGYPALQVSVLPLHEAEALARCVGFPEGVTPSSVSPGMMRERVGRELPPSWQVNHSPNDGMETLDTRAFLLMSRLLRELSFFRFPLRLSS